MARGFLAGALAGIVVIGGGLAVLSLTTAPQPETLMPAPETSTVAPAAPDAPAPVQGESIAAPHDELATPVEPEAAPSAPGGDSGAEVTPQTVTPPQAVEVGDSAAAAPQAPTDDAQAVMPAPASPVTTADNPAEPGAVTSTEPAPVITPTQAPEVGESTPAPQSPGTDEISPQPGPAGDAAVDPTRGDAPDTPQAEAQPPAAPAPASPVAGEQAEAIAPAPSDGQGPEVAALEPATRPGPPSTLDAGRAAENPPEAGAPPAPTPTDSAAPETPAPGLSSGRAGRVGDLAANVTTGRLPSIGTQDPADDAAPTVQPGAPGTGATPAAEADAPDPDAPPLIRNAAAYEANGATPAMSVILIDLPPVREGLGDLKNLPFPVSFVVDATQPDAAEAIRFYRQFGAEVVLALSLPQGARPSDVEVVFEARAPLLDQAVAVMMAKQTGFQTLGPTATQVGAVLASKGLGLITLPQGLNTGYKSALKEGAAAGLVFREIDNDGQSASVMRRFLDNAAFRARQEPGVIILGHARRETVNALIEWSLGNRAKSVALAPVSALLRR